MKFSIDQLKNVWDTWDLRGFIILSLSLQAFLILSAPLRKRTANSFVVVPLWLAYLVADAAANFAVGLISKSQRNIDSSAYNPIQGLHAFWAPFLLVHLGGPDTITAFALEDNELWLRHLLQLVFQSGTAAYVFILTLTKNELWLPTLLMFLAGLIKYTERTRSLYLASTRRFRESLLTEPDPGPNYAKLMDEYFSKKEAKLPTRIVMIPEPNRVAKTIDEVNTKHLTDLEVVQHASKFFDTFKGLIADLIFSFRERNQCRDFFLKRTAKDAFKIVEVELNFFYEILYTKAVVIQGVVGYFFRFLSFTSVVVSLVLFCLTEKKDFPKVEVKITYALLGCGIALDIVAFFMLILSDWTAIALTKTDNPSLFTTFLGKLLFVDRERWIEDSTQPHPFRLRLVMPVLRRRWSGYLSQYNLIDYCLHPWSKKTETVIGLLGLTNIFDGIKYVKKEKFTKELRDFIFDELRKKSEMADDLETAKEICSGKGDWILGIEGCSTLLPYSVQVDYDESLLLWHIATELCYSTDKGNDQNKDFREFSKLLSDYMVYLLIMQPTMMSAVAGIGQIRFRDTCAEAKKFFRGRKIGNQQEEKQSCLSIPHFDNCLCCRKSEQGKEQPQGNQEASPGEQPELEKEKAQSCPNMLCWFKNWCRKEKTGPDKEHVLACSSILAVNTEVKPVTVKGDRSKSVLFDGCILAKKLMDLEKNEKDKDKDKWVIMSKVWVELLSYAACHCRANTHAAQLSKGGQLITLVWLLMAHLGLGEQFQINEGHARAKLIVGK